MEFVLPYNKEHNYKDILDAICSTIEKNGYITINEVCRLVHPGDVYLFGAHYGWRKDVHFTCSFSSTSKKDVLVFPEPEELFTDMPKQNHVDMVNHPSHYQSTGGMEVINVIEAFTAGLQGIEATDTGNVIKYICRWKHKNGVEDLKKARWYIDHLINKLEEESNK